MSKFPLKLNETTILILLTFAKWLIFFLELCFNYKKYSRKTGKINEKKKY